MRVTIKSVNLLEALLATTSITFGRRCRKMLTLGTLRHHLPERSEIKGKGRLSFRKRKKNRKERSISRSS